MDIIIHRNGENYGPFTLDQIKEDLKNGTLVKDDLAWREGSEKWSSVGEIVTPITSPSKHSIQPTSPIPNSMISCTKRYNAAYITTQAVISFGSAVKGLAIILGFVIGGGLFVLCLLRGWYANGEDGILGGFITGAILFGVALVMCGILFILGIIIQASGQIQQALLDIAVHTSPFLNREEMASVMKIK
jgi:hypothetical protein